MGEAAEENNTNRYQLFKKSRADWRLTFSVSSRGPGCASSAPPGGAARRRGLARSAAASCGRCSTGAAGPRSPAPPPTAVWSRTPQWSSCYSVESWAPLVRTRTRSRACKTSQLSCSKRTTAFVTIRYS